MIDPLNKLAKWRMILAGWHHGTTTHDAPGSRAMRDLMEKWLIMRAEASALAALLVEKQVFTAEEFTAAVHTEAGRLDKDMETFFPGFRTVESGVEIYDLQLARETQKRLGFPP